jgi:Co/Zn/Cd efflux system component
MAFFVAPKTGPHPVSVPRLLGQILLLALGGMTIFEVIKSLLHPEITLWDSHVVTILFSGLVATLAGLMVLRRQEHLHQQLVEEVRAVSV